MPRLHNAILWQSHRSGQWICEIYNHTGFQGIGIGLNKDLAEQRARAVAGIDSPQRLQRSDDFVKVLDPNRTPISS